jgi:hypothetical protein
MRSNDVSDEPLGCCLDFEQSAERDEEEERIEL